MTTNDTHGLSMEARRDLWRAYAEALEWAAMARGTTDEDDAQQEVEDAEQALTEAGER